MSCRREIYRQFLRSFCNGYNVAVVDFNTLAASIAESVINGLTSVHLSVCPVSILLTVTHQSPEASMRRNQRTFRPDSKEARHTSCIIRAAR